jgi:predicted nucleotidyltransferase
MVSESEVKLITNYFLQREDTIAVYLFGSTVKNRERQESDLDLAVLFNECMGQFQRFEAKLQVANELEDQIKKKIDIVDLRSADLFFIHQVMKNKKIILDRDTHSRVSFEVKFRKMYFDHMPFYEQYHRQSRKRLREREG